MADTLGHGIGAVDEVNEGFVVGVDRTTGGEVGNNSCRIYRRRLTDLMIVVRPSSSASNEVR